MKNIVMAAIMFMLFMGVVSASSVNGDYKGNPKVIVYVNGKTIKSTVPAIIYSGSPLIPLKEVVEAMGGSVNWNALKNSATITTKSSNSPMNSASILSAMIRDNVNSTKWNGSNVKYVINELGSYVSVDIQGTSNINNDFNNIATVSVYLSDTDANLIFVNYYIGSENTGFYSIGRDAVDKMLYGKNSMSPKEYSKLWKWNPTNNRSAPPVINTVPATTNDAIETTIDGEFSGWTGETIFKLSNGQIWQQSLYAYYYYYAYSPNVIIYSSSGGYKMKVEGIDDTIYVKRIK